MSNPAAIPCRVMADLAAHEADLRAAPIEQFDSHNDEHVAALVPEKLVHAVHCLLMTRQALQTAEGSFGADPAKVAKWMKADLDRLHTACLEMWRDL